MNTTVGAKTTNSQSRKHKFSCFSRQIGTEPSDNQYLVVDIGLAVRILFQAQDGFGLDEGVLQTIPWQAFYNHDGIIFPDTIWFLKTTFLTAFHILLILYKKKRFKGCSHSPNFIYIKKNISKCYSHPHVKYL